MLDREDLIEGRNAVQEALRAGRPMDKIYIAKGETDKTLAHIVAAAREAGVVIKDCDRRKLDAMSATGAHQITSTVCQGVQEGSAGSLAVLDGAVFYKSVNGVCIDDGGGITEIGGNLGDTPYLSADGVIYNGKYYLSMLHQGTRSLFVYDIAKRMWHREQGRDMKCFAAGNGRLYTETYGNILDLTGNTGTLEEDVSWMAVTGDLGLDIPEQKYISRLTLRLSLDPGATLEVYARYDREQTWVKLGQVYGTDLRSFSLPVRPRRCDQLRLKLQGTGMCKLYSITKTLQKGSELP